MTPPLLTLTRQAATPWGTFGRLTTPRGFTLHTLEPHWRNNERNHSCIPPGRYAMEHTPSPIIDRITLSKHRHGWRLRAVPGRSDILIHPGNFHTDSAGCILIGMDTQAINGTPGVVRSQFAFALLMRELDPARTHFLNVIWADAQPVHQDA